MNTQGLSNTREVSEIRWRRNFCFDLVKSVPAGAIETMIVTFSILIANKVFGFGALEKIAFTGANAMGFFVSLFIVPIVRRVQLSVNISSFLIWSISGCSFLGAAFCKNHPLLYLVLTLLAMISLSTVIPLISQIHRQLYPDKIRGTLFSIGGLVRAGVAGIFAWAAGLWLDNNEQDFKMLLIIFSLSCWMMGGAVLAMDKVHLRNSKKLSLLESFHHAGNDKAFRKLLISWMMLGFGNLLGMVLFVEYITNPKFGFGYSSADVALLTSTIPMTVFVIMIVPWGVLFDRMPFYKLRLIINIFFLIGIAVYFLGNGYNTLALGMVFHALGKSGGKILWSLWVTKFANAEHVSEYMSVHTFLTGIRGVLSPVIAFSLIEIAGPEVIKFIACSSIILIFAASTMLLPEFLEEKNKLKAKT